jgi:hypothetical protein
MTDPVGAVGNLTFAPSSPATSCWDSARAMVCAAAAHHEGPTGGDGRRWVGDGRAADARHYGTGKNSCGGKKGGVTLGCRVARITMGGSHVLSDLFQNCILLWDFFSNLRIALIMGRREYNQS